MCIQRIIKYFVSFFLMNPPVVYCSAARTFKLFIHVWKILTLNVLFFMSEPQVALKVLSVNMCNYSPRILHMLYILYCMWNV